MMAFDRVLRTVIARAFRKRGVNERLMASSFVYSNYDFVFDVNVKQEHALSKFDNELRTRWSDAMTKGLFRYDVSALKTRLTEGKYSYLLQLNSRRALERRSPEMILSMQTPFDGTRFNFTRISPSEILFRMQCSISDQNQQKVSCDLQRNDSQHLIVINVSPLEFGHVLIVPDVDKGLPQVLTLTSIELAVQVLLLSSHPGFRIGFNSLCAMASVNHLHLHAWYLEHRMYTESAPVKQVHGDFYELLDYPAQGFVFQLHNTSVHCLVRRVFEVVNYLQGKEVAHNMFMTRGTAFEDESIYTVRIYVWPRQSSIGKKGDTVETVDVFNVAVCELAGHLPIYLPSQFPEITEDFIVDRIRQQMLAPSVFAELREGIKSALLAKNLLSLNKD